MDRPPAPHSSAGGSTWHGVLSTRSRSAQAA
jgi:hypothetical protein